MNPNRIAGICMLAGIVPAVAINKMIDRKLARAEKPGRLNTWYRGQLKWGRTWGVAINLVWGALKIASDLESAAPKANDLQDNYTCPCGKEQCVEFDGHMYMQDIADEAAQDEEDRQADEALAQHYFHEDELAVAHWIIEPLRLNISFNRIAYVLDRNIPIAEAADIYRRCRAVLEAERAQASFSV